MQRHSSKHAILVILILCISAVTPKIPAQSHPERLRREDSFLGIHFDFHAGYDWLNDTKGSSDPAATIRKLGKGTIAAVYLNLGERYLNARTATARNFLNGLVRELFPEPLVEVTGSRHVDVIAKRINGKHVVNIVNTSGKHENDKIFVFDDIPSVGPLSVTIRSDRKPRNVDLEPGGRTVSYTYNGGKIRLTIPRLEIHDIIMVEE